MRAALADALQDPSLDLVDLTQQPAGTSGVKHRRPMPSMLRPPARIAT